MSTVETRRAAAAPVPLRRTASGSKGSKGATVAAVFAATILLLSAAPAFTQNGRSRPSGHGHASRSELTEAPPPPRILEEERAKPRPPASASRPPIGQAPLGLGQTPFQARLAPPTAGRDDDLEEIIVVGKNDGSHLPDLGGTLRTAREAEQDQGRIQVTFLPLYDDSSLAPGRDDSLFGNREMQRVGHINLFRLRFGHRSKE